MSGPLEGVRVIEVAMYAFAPSAGSVLVDWGAEVIKVEHPETGDPIRGLHTYGVKPGDGGVTFMHEILNHGKRSVGIDIKVPGGREALMRLVDSADVFMTSFMAPARRSLGIDVADVMNRNPQIIYARGTGHGPAGPDADKGGYDGVSFWARSGVSIAAMAEGSDDYPVLLPGPGYGDTQAGAHLAGGIAAALFQRSRTGRGAVVDGSLLAGGLWAMQASLAGAHVAGLDRLHQRDRHRPPNPLWNTYRTSDGRFINLSMIESDRYWPGMCKVCGCSELIDDPRFATNAARVEHIEEITSIIEQAFAAHTMDEWVELLGAQDGPWAVVQTPREVLHDQQAGENQFIRWLEYDGGHVLPFVSAPARVDGALATLEPAPAHAVDTDELLASVGYTVDELLELKIAGAIT